MSIRSRRTAAAGEGAALKFAGLLGLGEGPVRCAFWRCAVGWMLIIAAGPAGFGVLCQLAGAWSWVALPAGCGAALMLGAAGLAAGWPVLTALQRAIAAWAVAVALWTPLVVIALAGS